jgi:hypothetical protein
MTVHVAKHEYFHFHPFKYFTRFFQYSIWSLFVGTIVFIIALLLLASSIFMGLLLSIELISG